MRILRGLLGEGRWFRTKATEERAQITLAPDISGTHAGIKVQFGAVFLGRALSQQRGGASKRRIKRRTLILQGAAARRRLCSPWQQDKTGSAVLTLRCRGQRSQRAAARRHVPVAAFIPGERLKSVQSEPIASPGSSTLRTNPSSADSPEEPNGIESIRVHLKRVSAPPQDFSD